MAGDERRRASGLGCGSDGGETQEGWGRFLRLQWKKGKSKRSTTIEQLERQSWRQAARAEGDVKSDPGQV